MYLIGTRVKVTGTSRLPSSPRTSRLVGRTGTVTLHEHGLNIVTGLTLLGGLVGHAFTDDDLTPAEQAR
ncbi:hypothetical protein ACF1BS_03455 [Streptomyces sp. NPDC014748]|uniref:hypothetical protein n=1 Tax=Streptomyces sp. NPDC014748 TaxID=3364905 RepID=UPI0036FEBF29